MEVVDAFSLVGLAFLLAKVLDFYKMLVSGNKHGAALQVIAWVAGVGLFFLASASTMFGGFEIGTKTLLDFDWASKVLGGLVLGSSASIAYDATKGKSGGVVGSVGEVAGDHHNV